MGDKELQNWGLRDGIKLADKVFRTIRQPCKKGTQKILLYLECVEQSQAANGKLFVCQSLISDVLQPSWPFP